MIKSTEVISICSAVNKELQGIHIKLRVD